MSLIIPIYQDIRDYMVVRDKTISRIALADIMDDKMIIRWYSKLLDSKILLRGLRGFGYFESDYTHGFLMSTFRFNQMAIEVIRFQMNLRGLNARNNRDISLIEQRLKTFE